MKGVLILNRRCIKHPERGGAEVYTFELAKALIEHGCNVEWFSSKAIGLDDKEEIDGITFVRKGNELTTHFYGFLYALKKKDCFIVDEFNGIGFFTFFMRDSIILIHQTYNEFWTSELGLIGYPLKYIEKILLFLYKGRPAITVSDSTCRDLKKIGFKNIEIIHNGIDIKPLDHMPEKESALTLIYLGRLKQTKNPEDAIRAFLLIRNTIKDAKLWIAGDGPLYNPLKEQYKKTEGVSFLGYLNDKEKYQHLKKAHFLLMPSIREGWGQVVIQANAMGTPAIGYNVKGLQDSIKDGETGVLVSNYQAMASEVIELWSNKRKYLKLGEKALEWARQFSWERTRKEFIAYFNREK
ncbi:MAG: glycosyltransferase family 4 protein [Dissulfurispiraceae bacterium]